MLSKLDQLDRAYITINIVLPSADTAELRSISHPRSFNDLGIIRKHYISTITMLKHNRRAQSLLIAAAILRSVLHRVRADEVFDCLDAAVEVAEKLLRIPWALR